MTFCSFNLDLTLRVERLIVGKKNSISRQRAEGRKLESKVFST